MLQPLTRRIESHHLKSLIRIDPQISFIEVDRPELETLFSCGPCPAALSFNTVRDKHWRIQGKLTKVSKPIRKALKPPRIAQSCLPQSSFDIAAAPWAPTYVAQPPSLRWTVFRKATPRHRRTAPMDQASRDG